MLLPRCACSWNQKVFSSEGLKSYLLPHVISDKFVNPEEMKSIPLNLDDHFTVFSMSQWIHRKGFDALVKAFCMEFNDTPDALLIIKTYVNAMNLDQFGLDKQYKIVARDIVSNKNQVLKGGRVSNAKIVPICDILPFSQVSWLYSKADVLCALCTQQLPLLLLLDSTWIANSSVRLEYMQFVANITFPRLRQRLILPIIDFPLQLIIAPLTQKVEWRLHNLFGLLAFRIMLILVAILVSLGDLLLTTTITWTFYIHLKNFGMLFN